MLTIKCHFDGKSLVPDEPINLAPGESVVAHIERPGIPEQNGKASALEWLFEQAVDDSSVPEDLSYQHDHYLYGTPKKP